MFKKVSDKYFEANYEGDDKPAIFKEVEAKKIIIKGFENFDLFVQKKVDEIENEVRWSVGEGITGCCLIKYWGLKRDAKEKTRKILIKNGKNKIKSGILKSVERYGLSPRYQEVDNDHE